MNLNVTAIATNKVSAQSLKRHLEACGLRDIQLTPANSHLTCADILDICCVALNINKEIITGPGRETCNVTPRFVYCTTARQYTTATPEEIGVKIGRSRRAIVHAIDTTTALLTLKDPEITIAYNKVVEAVEILLAQS